MRQKDKDKEKLRKNYKTGNREAKEGAQRIAEKKKA